MLPEHSRSKTDDWQRLLLAMHNPAWTSLTLSGSQTNVKLQTCLVDAQIPINQVFLLPPRSRCIPQSIFLYLSFTLTPSPSFFPLTHIILFLVSFAKFMRWSGIHTVRNTDDGVRGVEVQVPRVTESCQSNMCDTTVWNEGGRKGWGG